MDFETAYHLARTIEEAHPSVVVVGLRRTQPDSADSWAVDILNRGSTRMATIDEKDLVDARVREVAETS